MHRTEVLFGFVFSVFVFSSLGFAAALDITVGFDKITYGLSDNVTISGYAKTTMGLPYSGNLGIVLTPPVGAASTYSAVSSSGTYSYGPLALGSTEGTYSVQVVAASGTDSGSGHGEFDLEAKRRYTLTTDKSICSAGDNVTATLLVEKIASDGTATLSSGDAVKIKIQRDTGVVVVTETVTTNSNGTATITYNVNASSPYGLYSVVAGKGLAIATFDVPSYSVSVDLQDSEGASRYLYSTDDALIISVTAATESEKATGKVVVPLRSASIVAYIKNSAGDVVKTLSTFTQSTDGAYYSNSYSLANLTNGAYTIRTEVSKNNLTQTKYAEFKVSRLRIEVIPIQENSKLNGFLKGQSASFGLMVMDLKTGKELKGETVTSATISECRDENWLSCTIGAGTVRAGDKKFAKIIDFEAPTAQGEYSFKVDVNVTISDSGTDTNISGSGWAGVYVGNVMAYAEVRDSFGGWRHDFGPGEKVKFVFKAFGSSLQSVAINSVSVTEVRNDTWDDVLSTVEIDSTSSSNDEVVIYAPEKAGWYNVKFKVNTTNGTTYAMEGFGVRRYHVWADAMDKDNSWAWRFGPSDDIYLHVMVNDLGWQQVSSSKFSVTVDSIVSEMTGERYEDKMNVTKMADDDFGRPVVKFGLGNLNLTSGHYRVELSIIDMDGNKEYGGAWFKVSELNVWSGTLDSNGDWKWNFAPTDNITFRVNAQYFNGSAVPDGAAVSVEALMTMKEGPPVKVPSDVYEAAQGAVISGGVADLWIKAKSSENKKFAEGHHMAIIKVNDSSSGKVEMQEGWFDIRLMDVWGYAQQWVVAPGENVSIVISAKKLDGTPIDNATVRLSELHNTATWSPVTLPSWSPINTTSGSATFRFSAENLTNGEYEARLSVTSDALGAMSEVFVWFSVKTYSISGWFADQSKDTRAPGDSVEMWVEVKYPNGTAAPGETVSIYQLARTDTWPQTYVNASGSIAVTDSQGRAKITFIAPTTSGYYNPMLNLSGELSNSPWELPGTYVKSASVSVNLYDNATGAWDDNFGPDDVIRVTVGFDSTTNINNIKFYMTNVGSNPTSDNLVGLVSSSDVALTTTKTIKLSDLTLTPGEYILHTKVNVTTASGYVDVWEKKWLKIEELSFNVDWWSNSWSYTPGGTVSVSMHSYPERNFTVSLVRVRDVRSWSDAGITASAQNITDGNGDYTFNAPNETGEYEAELCIYTGASCGDTSKRAYVWFSIETFFAWMWSEQPTYTPGETVTVNVLAFYPNKTAIETSAYNLSFIEMRDAATWSDKSSLVNSSSIVEGTDSFWEGEGKTLTFSAPSESGEYMFRIKLTRGSDTRDMDIWLKVSTFKLTLDTDPPTKWTGNQRFGVGENITFKVTLSPADTQSGTLEIKNDYNWETLAEYPLDIASGVGYVNVSLNSAGQYMAIARVGTAEDNYWFQATAFGVEIKHDISAHELKKADNLTVIFNVSEIDGSEYSGDVNVSVVRIRNAWDWSVVAGSDASPAYSTVVSAGTGNENFTFAHNLDTGEYDLEMRFEKGGKTVYEGFWFRVKDKEFWAWPTQASYMPGENVTLNIFIGQPGGMEGIAGVNVSLQSIKHTTTWTDVTGAVVQVQPSAVTDANGNAAIIFTTPQDKTGKFEVELMENGSDMRTFTQYQVNGLDVRFSRANDIWMYAPGEYFAGTLYVYSSSGSPAANRSVNITLRKHDWTPVNSTIASGATGADGQFLVNFSVPAETTEYVAVMSVDNGAAEMHEWFSVQSMKLDVSAVGESSGRSDEIQNTDNVLVTVYVRDSLNQPIIGANVTLGDKDGAKVRSMNGWMPVDISGSEITSFSTSDSYGRAELKFSAANLSVGDYEARLNVTANISGSLTEAEMGAWFRIIPYSMSIEFVCPEGVTNCDPRRTSGGGQLTAQVNLSSINITDEPNTRLCLDRVRNIFTGFETDYNPDACATYDNVKKTISLTFTTPTEQAEYDAVFKVYVNNEFLGERWEWFRAGGELDAWAWMNPPNAWIGQNSTIGLEVWDPSMWQPISKNCTSVAVTKIIDTNTWTVVDETPTYYAIGINADSPDPMAQQSYMIAFTPEENLQAGKEYMAQIEATCLGKPVKAETWFRVNSFEVSSMMKEFLKANEDVKYWVKVTYGNGTPLSGANVTLERIVDSWSWNTLKEYNIVYTTDENGEFQGNFTAPDHPGEYNLQLNVMDSDGTKQRVDRWFRIRQMEITTGFKDNSGENKLLFWEGDNVTVDIVVKDPVSSAPISGANVNINVWPHCEFKDMMVEDGYNETEMMDCPSMFFSSTTDMNGVVSVHLDGSQLKAGSYEVNLDVNHYERGSAWDHKAFSVRLFNITISGLATQYLQPGEQLNVSIIAMNKTGSALPDGSSVKSGIELFAMTYGSDLDVTNANGTLSEGAVNLTLDIPANATPGPGILYAFVESENRTNEEMSFIVMKGNNTINVTTVGGTLAPNELFTINVTADDPTLQMEPMAMHLRKIEGTIPMFEMKSGAGPESGKEMFYQSPIYFENVNGTGMMHVMLQAQPRSGSYAAMLIFSKKGSLMMGPQEDSQFVFIDYTVLADSQPPAAVESLVAVNINTTGEASLEWSKSNDNVAVVKYKVYANQSDTNITDVTSISPVKLVGSLYNDTVVSGLTNDASWCFAVTAVDAEGNENKTIVAKDCVTPTKETTPPEINLTFPENNVIINESNKAEIPSVFGWNATDGMPGIGVSGLSSYFLQMSDTPDFNTSCTLNITKYVYEAAEEVFGNWSSVGDTLCGTNKTYQWHVTAFDRAGNSQLSSLWAFTLNITL